MNRCLSFLAGVVCVLAVGSCGSSAKPMVGKTCLVNSECDNPLSCTAGKCHEECSLERDCSPGSRCVTDKATGKHVCQLPAEMPRCAMNSDCLLGLVCARDLQCRTECTMDRDCPGKNQKCIELACADPG